jgi:shikimate kinase
MLAKGDRQKVLSDLMEARDPLYREIADLVVDTDGRRVQKVAKEIYDEL